MVNNENLFPVEGMVNAFLKDKNNHSENNITSSGSAIEKSYTLLLIDDNTELAEFIVANLPDYKVIWAKDGAEGLQQALKIIPDLIICDVLMPVMDGYECCRRIKEDKTTSHIPVILLTSKNFPDDYMARLLVKADNYLEKPFDIKELQLKVRSLLHQHLQHKRVHKKLVNTNNLETEHDYFTLITAEDPFLKEVCAIIEAKFEDADFDVEELAKQLFTSRANLHRKLKALIGLSPGSIIHKYRMWYAVKYLKQGLNSSETAYRTGFDNPSYFTKCFKEFYKQAPLEFIRQEI